MINVAVDFLVSLLLSTHRRGHLLSYWICIYLKLLINICTLNLEAYSVGRARTPLVLR